MNTAVFGNNAVFESPSDGIRSISGQCETPSPPPFLSKHKKSSFLRELGEYVVRFRPSRKYGPTTHRDAKSQQKRVILGLIMFSKHSYLELVSGKSVFFFSILIGRSNAPVPSYRSLRFPTIGRPVRGANNIEILRYAFAVGRRPLNRRPTNSGPVPDQSIV